MAENDSSRSEIPASETNSPPQESPAGGFLGLLHLWFGFRQEVGRGAYALTGFGLAALKYGVEAAVLRSINRVVFTPLDYLNPVLSAREELIQGTPEWLGWAWFFWTLPFLWIAVTMSVRRAADAGRSPWVGLLVLVPLINLITMVILALLPHSPDARWIERREAASALHFTRSVIMGVGVGLLIALAMVGVSVYAFDSYGASLFLGTPVLMGVVASVTFNLAAPRSTSSSSLMGMLTVMLAGGVLLLFALEGIICIAMAAPIVVPLGGLGGVIGKAIAETSLSPTRGMTAAILFLPIWAGLESIVPHSREHVVVSQIEIDASAENVWKHVVDFPELPEPDEWYYRLGIACPIRATIDGQGVGAVRNCVFTTGVFVEPITAWEEPHRLAFDVTDQPAPMFELTPYRHVHPPHLDGTLRSNRGEFRLVALPDGRTRMEGRTWYEFDMFPQPYWTLWSDLMIRRIHDRVLTHIKVLAEADG